MEGILEALAVAVAAIAAAIAAIILAVAAAAVAVICWVLRMAWLGIYYTFHPHRDYIDHLL